MVPAMEAHCDADDAEDMGDIGCMDCMAAPEALLVVLPDVLPAVEDCDDAVPHNTCPYCGNSPFIVMYTIKPMKRPPNRTEDGLTAN